MDHDTERQWAASGLRPKNLEMFSGRYYAACAASGMVAAGATHFVLTPLDVLKVNLQANPVKYTNILSGFGTLWREQGVPGLWRGWSGKLYGYSVQGAAKFGLYEYFKKLLSDKAGPTNASAYKTLIYMASSASAQLLADAALCPFEAIKVRVQTRPDFAKGLVDGVPKLYRTEGIPGFYKALLPLWGRNLPFAIIMFSSFEHSVDFIYDRILHTKKLESSTAVQLGVTCAAGYSAGVVGTVVSNPADNIVSYLYKSKDHSLSQAFSSIGWMRLTTRSLPLRMALVGPMVTLQWVCYDAMKILLGLPTSGGLDPRLSDNKTLVEISPE